MDTKSALRKRFLLYLKEQGKEEQIEKSRRVMRKLFRLKVFKEAESVMFYVPLPGEVDTFAMITKAIQLHKKVVLPVIEQASKKLIPTRATSIEDLIAGPLGVREPVLSKSNRFNAAELDVVVVPGLAFDRANNRLGRGAGYYDRFLSTLPKDTATIGIAFDFQVIDRLPLQAHDVPMDLVIAA